MLSSAKSITVFEELVNGAQAFLMNVAETARERNNVLYSAKSLGEYKNTLTEEVRKLRELNHALITDNTALRRDWENKSKLAKAYRKLVKSSLKKK